MSAMDNAHGLVVGIANYRHVRSLPRTVLHDAQAVRDVLVDPLQGAYPPQHVRLLLDDQADRASICQALADVAQQADASSTAFLFFSCHGARIDRWEYLLPVDTFVSSGALDVSSAISGSEFTEALRSIPARKVVVIFDCCNAGGIGEPKDALGLQIKGGLPDDFYQRLSGGVGRVILASSRDSEYSWIQPGAANSLFTQQLLAGLRGGVKARDGLITIFDLFEYVSAGVTRTRADQHVVFKCQTEANFPVALSPGVQTPDPGSFAHDVYVTYAEADEPWVEAELAPRLIAAGVRLVSAREDAIPGVPRVVNSESGIRMARRTLVVLTEAFLEDAWADFDATLAQTLGIEEGLYRLVPLIRHPVELPMRLKLLTAVDVSRPERAEREYARLIKALQSDLTSQVSRT
jgi:hypothetical protein